MKKQWMMLLLWVAIPCSAMAQSWDVGGAYQYYFPSDSLWKSQLTGAEARLTYWFGDQLPEWGLALNLGQSEWTAGSQVVRSEVKRTDTLEGDADYTLCMLSVLTRDRLPELPWYWCTLEAGVGLMSGDPDLQVKRVTETTDTDIDIDTEYFTLDGDGDVWLGRIAVGLEFWPDSTDSAFMLYTKLGYQFDLSSASVGESDWLNYEQDLSLSGAFVQLGAAIMLR